MISKNILVVGAICGRIYKMSYNSVLLAAAEAGHATNKMTMSRLLGKMVIGLFFVVNPSLARAAEEARSLDPMAPILGCPLLPAITEDFDGLSIAPRELGGARWIAHTPWNGDFGDASFDDPGPNGPFVIKDGVLEIVARKDDNGKWHSGLIAAADASGRGHVIRYGYFEIRMKMPFGPGTWPAFWLGTLPPSDPAAPGIEIDVLEYYGHDTSKFQSAVHVWNKNDTLSRHTVHSTPVPSGSLANDFHTFGVRVAPDLITFYLDRHAVWQVDTPPELNMPLYPIANLALGSGYPINQTPNPSRLLIDYIHTFGPIEEGQSDHVGCKGGKP